MTDDVDGLYDFGTASTTLGSTEDLYDLNSSAPSDVKEERKPDPIVTEEKAIVAKAVTVPATANTVIVGNLPWWTTTDTIEKLLGEFGTVRDMRLFEDKVNGKFRGYLQAEFTNWDSASTCVSKLNSREVDDKVIAVGFFSPALLQQYNAQSGQQQHANSYRGARGGASTPGAVTNAAARGRGRAAYPPARGAFVPPIMPGGFPPPFPLPGRGRAMPFAPVTPHVNPAFLGAGLPLMPPMPMAMPPMMPPFAAPVAESWPSHADSNNDDRRESASSRRSERDDRDDDRRDRRSYERRERSRSRERDRDRRRSRSPERRYERSRR